MGRPVEVATYELISNAEKPDRDPVDWVLLGARLFCGCCFFE
jgi:hypothetical protein